MKTSILYMLATMLPIMGMKTKRTIRCNIVLCFTVNYV